MYFQRFAQSPVGRLVPIRGTDGRTGRAYDHVAFLPDPLGSIPTLSNEAWAGVSRAAYALGRLQQASRQLGAPELLRRPTLRREAQSTSALEGTFAPLQEVFAAELLDPPSPSAELREVMNYVRTAEAAFGWIREERPITVAMLCELQRILVTDTPSHTLDAGRVRRIQVAIGSPDGGLEQARFVAPAARDSARIRPARPRRLDQPPPCRRGSHRGGRDGSLPVRDAASLQ